MSETHAIIDALKHVLKTRGLTYADVATGLELSEASVKRLFAQRTFSLSRLEQVCQLVNVEIAELTQMALEQRGFVEMLTEEQEREVVRDPGLLLVGYLTLHRFSLEEITEMYDLEELQVIQYLARLDRLNIIELQPGNRARLKVAPNFRWRPGGPIESYFIGHVREDFFNCDFSDESEMNVFVYGMLSRESHQRITRRLQGVIDEYRALNREDQRLPLDQRSGSSMIIAKRNWGFDAFEAMKRPGMEHRPIRPQGATS